MKTFSRFGIVATVLVVSTATAAGVAWAGFNRGPADTAADRALAHRAPPTYQPSSELTYVPVTPCQVVNTRRSGKVLGHNKTKVYQVAGSGLGSQGGNPGGCEVPASATAASLNLLVTSPKKAGSLRIGAGGSTPNQTAVTYQKKLAATGGVTSQVDGSGIKVVNQGGPTDLTVVVTGYYQKPMAGFISPSGTPYAGSSRILDGARTGTGIYEVRFDRDIRYCSATATPYVSSYYASVTTWFDSTRPDTLRVSLWDANGNAVDQYFYVAVAC